MKTALITGINGQDAAYLAHYLLSIGYTVIGGKRRTSESENWRLERLGIAAHRRLRIVDLDICDYSNCLRVIAETRPDEIYNLAAQSHVGLSFSQPDTTTLTNAIGVKNLLEAIRFTHVESRFYQASTSEMFGKVVELPQTESTSFHPRSPYGVAKLYAHWLTINYRESFNIFGACGILFNHESPLRTTDFVTRKITNGFARISAGDELVIRLGNLDAIRDWGYAKEYVVGMWKILQQQAPSTYVLATNKTTSVREFVEMSAAASDIDGEFTGAGLSERFINKKTGKCIVEVDSRLYRPAEVEVLKGCADKALTDLGWRAETSIARLVEIMVEEDRRTLGLAGRATYSLANNSVTKSHYLTRH